MLKIITTGIAGLALAALFAPVAASAHESGWHRDDRHHHRKHDHRKYRSARCAHDKGNGGLVIGGIAGGLLGRSIAGDKTAGTIIGGGVGALAGREIDRKNGKC